MQKNKSKKVLIIILALVATIVIGCITLVSCSTFLLLNSELGLKKTPLTGEIEVLSELRVNVPTGLILEVPEKLKDLHKEMWDVTFIGDDGKEEALFDNIIDGSQIVEMYTSEQIEKLFGTADISKYHDKAAVFTPSKIGKYRIAVFGYYKTTSPRSVTSLEIEVKN